MEEILHQLIWYISHSLQWQGVIHAYMLGGAGFSSINSSFRIPPKRNKYNEFMVVTGSTLNFNGGGGMNLPLLQGLESWKIGDFMGSLAWQPIRIILF